MAVGAAWDRCGPSVGGPGGGDPDPPDPIDNTPATLVDVTPSPVPASIANNGTLYGRRLNIGHVLTNDGHLLFCYGDYGSNTGPIDVIGYRPSDGNLVTYLTALPDERIEDYRILNDGWIWTCPTDPRGRDEARLGTNVGGTWHEVIAQVPGKGVAVHLFDVTQTSNGDLFVCLARNFTEAEMVSQSTLPDFNPDAEYNTGLAVWKSTNGGTTWTEDFVDLKNNDGYYRPYGMVTINDTIVLPTSDGTHYVRSSDGTWSARRTTPALYVYRPPILSYDRQSFHSSSNGGVVWTVTNGLVVSSTPYAGFSQAIGSGPDGWIWLDGYNRLHYGNVLIGALPMSGETYRAVVDSDDSMFLSNGQAVLRVER